MRRELERQSTGLLSRHVRAASASRSAFGPRLRRVQRAARVERAPGDAPASPPRGGIGRRTGLRNRSPQGMSVRLGPRGPASSPVAQRQSSALIRRRPVDRAHPGPPATRDHQPPKEVCHEADRPRRRELSRSRASGAEASPPRRGSSAVIVLSAAPRSLSRSSAATTRARAAPRGPFKRCCLRSGCF